MNKVLFVLLNVLLTIIFSVSTLLLGGYLIRQNILSTVAEKQNNVVSTVESDIEKIYDNTVDGVVFIEAEFRQGTGTGSGFIYKIDGEEAYVLTNFHVAGDADDLEITLHNGEEIADVEFLGGDELYDIAVLKIPASDAMKELPLKENSSYSVGEHVLAIGSPLGEDFVNTATYGIISGKDRFLEINSTNSWGLWLIQTDTVINPGNSGGPLFSLDGEVIGINTLKFVDEMVEGMGFAIPMETVIPKLSAFEKGEEVRTSLGLSAKDTSEGVEVTDIDKDGNADRGGFEEGEKDKITQ